ncbi:MarR family winged helix-turn-helix transcriptional regulator [Nocardia sp. NPDC059180]|uniref:MarR family winged helix-turn-helix transcriptional regulator n=1 Tax=Nocardia sp. NPDC059180 TaxID=3346761 RepID=UPI0036749A3A
MSKEEQIGAIGQQLRLLQQSFDTFDETAAAHLGLNRTDMRCLDILLGRGPSAAGELSAALRLSPAATTTVIDRLVRAGFATRAQDPDNRRRVLVTATDAARAVDAELFLPVAEAGGQALTRYDEASLALILDFLQTAFDVHQEQTRLLAERSSGD